MKNYTNSKFKIFEVDLIDFGLKYADSKRIFFVLSSVPDLTPPIIPPKPKTPRPTTLNPITDPPLNATLSAVASPLLAAFVVRLFDFVATLIPKNPANPDAAAPTKKDKATKALESLLL